MNDTETEIPQIELPKDKILGLVKRDVQDTLKDQTVTSEKRYIKVAKLFEDAKAKGATDQELIDLTGVDKHPQEKIEGLKNLREATRDMHVMVQQMNEQGKLKQASRMREAVELVMQKGVTREEIRDTYYPEAIEYHVRNIAGKLATKQKIPADYDAMVRQMIDTAKESGLSSEIVEDIFTRVARETGVSKKSLLDKQVEKVKEGFLDFAKTKTLRVKEMFGKIDRNDFADLMKEDFEEHARKNKPISKDELGKWNMHGGEFDREKFSTTHSVFSPEMTKDYKDMTDRQDRAIAACRTTICRQIEFDVETSKELLMKSVKLYQESYAFSQYQKWQTENLVDEITENYKAMKRRFNHHKSDPDLLADLTGVKVTDQQHQTLDIAIGPYGFEVTVDADVIESVKKEKLKNKIFLDGSIVTDSIGEKPFQVFLIDSKGDKEHELVKSRQHVKAKLFGRALVADLREEQSRVRGVGVDDDALDDEAWKIAKASQNLRDQRDVALERAKNEILAMRATTDMYPDYDLLFKNDESSHDHLVKLRKWTGASSNKVVRDLSKTILIEEYQDIAKSGISAMNKLIKEGGYSKDEAIASLVNIPINEWDALVANVLEAQRNRNS